jgi:hypothetical protein
MGVLVRRRLATYPVPTAKITNNQPFAVAKEPEQQLDIRRHLAIHESQNTCQRIQSSPSP